MFSTVIFLVFNTLFVLGEPETSKVLGGSPTTIDKFPVLAQLLLDSHGNQQFNQHCAGVILTIRHVISTAHCFQYNVRTGKNYSQPQFWRVRVGSTYRSRGGTILKVKSIHPHPSFHKVYHNNDIAVLTTSRNFVFDDFVRQGTIPKQGKEVKPNVETVLVGWGVVENGGSQPDQLQHVKLRTIDRNICKSRYTNISAIISDGMLCAGNLDVGGVDGCYGDSGGPLFYDGVVVGLMSFGYTCGHPYYPGVYTRVAYYSNWIVNTIYSNYF